MLLSEFIARGIDQAKAGLPPDQQAMVSAFELEAETLSRDALQRLATQTAANVKTRHLLSKQFTPAIQSDLTSGAQYVDVDPAMLTEYLGLGSVRVSDFANNNLGTALHRVVNYADFIKYLSPNFGYYCLHDNRIYVKAMASQSFFDAQGPIIVECPYVPTVDQVPPELENDAVLLLASLIRTGGLAVAAQANA